jgi:uncharacterized protein
MRNEEVVSSLAISETLNKVPVVSIDYVFADRAMIADAKKWLNKSKERIIRPREEGERNG